MSRPFDDSFSPRSDFRGMGLQPKISDVVITQHFCWVFATWIFPTLGIEEVGLPTNSEIVIVMGD